MSSLRRLVAALVVVALAAVSSGARAQQAPGPAPQAEPPPGYPPPQAPPPGYPPPQAPPPGYGAPGYPPPGYGSPQPGYGYPPPGYAPPPPGPNGVGLLISGAILLPVGFLFTVGALKPLLDGYDLLPGSSPGYSASDLSDQKVGVALFAVGFVVATTGIVLLAIGAGQRQRWLRARGVALGAGGLGLRF